MTDEITANTDVAHWQLKAMTRRIKNIVRNKNWVFVWFCVFFVIDNWVVLFRKMMIIQHSSFE